MTIGELLAGSGKRCTVYCGCIGWISGHKRGTPGLKAGAPVGTRIYYKCLTCGKIWHYRDE